MYSYVSLAKQYRTHIPMVTSSHKSALLGMVAPFLRQQTSPSWMVEAL